MLELEFFKTLFREITHPPTLERTPEQALVMSDEPSVSAYAKGGRDDGALAGAYLYHVAQMCRLIRPDDLVLDLGCGPASLLARLAQLNPRCEFIGVDLSEAMLRHAGEMLKQRGLSNIELRHGDLSRLTGVPDGSVDMVVSSMAFHHLPDFAALDRSFAEIARVLKPEGRLYLTDFGRLKSAASIGYFAGRAAANEEPELVEDYIQSLHAAFSKQEFEAMVQKHIPGRARVYATAISPLLIVVTGGERAPQTQRRELSRQYGALPPARKRDYREMQLFLRLGGLPSAL